MAHVVEKGKNTLTGQDTFGQGYVTWIELNIVETLKGNASVQTGMWTVAC